MCDNIQHLSEENSPTNSQNASEENSPTNSRYLSEQEQENSRKRKKSNEYSELLTSPILYEGYSYTRNAVRVASKFFRSEINIYDIYILYRKDWKYYWRI